MALLTAAKTHLPCNCLHVDVYPGDTNVISYQHLHTGVLRDQKLNSSRWTDDKLCPSADGALLSDGKEGVIGAFDGGDGSQEQNQEGSPAGKAVCSESTRVIFWKRQDPVWVRGCRAGVRGRFGCRRGTPGADGSAVS